MRLDFPALAENESFARMVAISGWLLPLEPDARRLLADVRSPPCPQGRRRPRSCARPTARAAAPSVMRAKYDDDGFVTIDVIDRGRGIADVAHARQPFYTTAEGEERSGMGFTVMESFMDAVDVQSAVGQGTTVRLVKHIDARAEPLARRA